jgi:glycosyltransferase involved in cell wall biosynthesis
VTNVALDAPRVGSRETGNETYAVQLFAALGRIGGYNYKLYTPHPQALPIGLRSSPAISVHPFRPVPSYIRIPYVYPKLLKADGARLLHVQYVAPPSAPCPSVVTVHDVSYKIYPEFFSPRVRLITALLVGPSMRRAAKVITLSESTKRDIMRFYKLPAHKVMVTPAAAGPQFRPQTEAEVNRVRERYRLSRQYLLAVGDVQPRKNLPRLVEAFGSIAGMSEAGVPDLQLVIAGRSAWRGSKVEAAAGRSLNSRREELTLGQLATRVSFTGYVPDDDLPALYSGATVFCYVSLYEGFGLPPLEAMACGTPVITSNVASLPEVVGDAAIQVNPTSVEEIAAAMRSLLTDQGVRDEYRRRGVERAAQFSWECTARMTRNVYDAVLGVQR